MHSRLILLSVLISSALSFPAIAKKKVAFSAIPYAGYRQDQIKWKTKLGDTQSWKKLQGMEYGVNTEITLKDRYKIDIDLGFANFFGGKMSDNDYLAAPGSADPIKNSLNGTGFVFQPNIAFGFNTKPTKSIDLTPLIGFSYDYIKLSGKKSSNNPLTSLSNKLNFYGPYVGFNSTTKFNKRLSMDLNAAFKLAFYNASGNWKFTGDATSNTMKQSGNGYGLKGQIGMKYLLVKTVALGGEAAVEWNRIRNGNDTRNFANGATKKQKFNANWTTLSGRVTLTKTF